eukprot:COSAG06_NODE_1251_length_10106_cov_8.031678_6_plen_79_part_00
MPPAPFRAYTPLMKVNWTYHGMHIDMTSTQSQKKLCPTWLILIVALDDRNETDDINRSDIHGFRYVAQQPNVCGLDHR